MADRAGVSVGLLYRYFPSKRAIVLALYDELSNTYAQRATEMPQGRWRDRFLAALETSLRVLGPHRVTLAALTLRLPPVRGFVQSADALFREALLDSPEA